MDNNELLELIANICIYYYTSYHYKILHEKVNIPYKIGYWLMRRIKKEYTMYKQTSDVFDISIMPFPYNNHYTITIDYLDIDSIMECIDSYIESHRYIYYNKLPQIDVVSISEHPLENYYVITHDWIKQAIDLYRY